MINKYIELLKSKIDNGTVEIKFFDGEEVIANIISVSETENDVIYKIVSSNKADQKHSENTINLSNLNDIEFVTEV